MFPRARRHSSGRSRLLGRKVAFAWAKLQPPRGASVLIRRRNRRSSRLLFLAEFLKSGIAAQRIPDGIHSKALQRHSAGATEQSVQQLDCASVVADDRVNLRNVLRHSRAVERIFALRSQIGRSLRFCDGSVLFAKPRQQLGHSNVQIWVVRLLLELLFENVLRSDERSASRCVIAQVSFSYADCKILRA